MNQHFLANYPNEACGIVVDSTFIPIPNTTDKDPTCNFKIDSSVIIEYGDEIEAIVHSHTQPLKLYDRVLDPRTPSHEDMLGQQATKLTWGICGTDGESVTTPLWFNPDDDPAELTGRPFIHNVYDCYTLVRDYYKINSGITLGIYPRPVEWEQFDKNLYTRYFKDEKFEEIDPQEIREGDSVLFHIYHRSFVDHAGVYVGDGKFLHHQFNRLSCVDDLARWNKHIAKVVRYTGDSTE
jgi:cell wall-associated NlpC family hydrolase